MLALRSPDLKREQSSRRNPGTAVRFATQLPAFARTFGRGPMWVMITPFPAFEPRERKHVLARLHGSKFRFNPNDSFTDLEHDLSTPTASYKPP